MAINIKDLEAERLARKAAKQLNCSITSSVKQALELLLSVQSNSPSAHTRAHELLKIGAHCAARKLMDVRSAEEILGYDKLGLPAGEI